MLNRGASCHFGIGVIERIPNLDPEMFKLVVEVRAQTRPEAKKFKPERFFDEAVMRKLYKKCFAKGKTGNVESTNCAERSAGLAKPRR